ncbi:MAG: calcium-binding protein [Myxococcota bacterium]
MHRSLLVPFLATVFAPQLAHAAPCTPTSHTPYCSASSASDVTCILPTMADLQSYVWTSSSGGSEVISLRIMKSGVDNCEHIPFTATSGALELTIEGSFERDYIYLSRGSEELESPSGTDLTVEVIDWGGDNHIEGSDSADITEHLHGGPDRDLIDTQGGGGYAYGGDDIDLLLGGSGDDYLYGEGDRDTLQGGGGVDHLFGDDDDFTTGDLSNNRLFGGDGDDHLFGSTGNDELVGFRRVDSADPYAELGPEDEFGHDTIFGGGGNDTIKGGRGTDTIFSGDPMIPIDGERDDIDGGDDRDIITGSADTVSVPSDIINGGGGPDTIYAEAGDDTITGGADVDEIYGGDGADTISGGSGQDLLFGENGNDIMDGGAGGDQMWGGFGNDIMDGGDSNDYMEGGPDNDRMCGQAGMDFMFGDNNGMGGFFGHCDYVHGGSTPGSVIIGLRQEVYGERGSMDLCSAGALEYTDMSCEGWMPGPNIDDSCLSAAHPDNTVDFTGEPIEACQPGFGQIH